MESVVIEILSIRTQGLLRVKGGYVSQSIVEETSVYVPGREKTHSAQAASFLEFHSMQEVK